MVSECQKISGYKREPGCLLNNHGRLLVGAAVGVGSDFEDRVKALVSVDTDILVVDSAHGHNKFIIDAVIWIKQQFPDLPLMAGKYFHL